MRLGDLLQDVQSGFACGEEAPDGIFQFRMHNVSPECSLALEKRRRVPLDAHRHMSRFVVRSGDVLFNATNSPDGVGKSIIVPELDEPAVFSNHFLRLRVDPARLDAAYLWRWLQFRHSKGFFVGMCRQWVNQASVDKERLLSLDLASPSLDEQRGVAAILDAADAIRVKRQQVLTHLDGLAQSVFRAMFEMPAASTVAAVAADVRTGPFGSQLLHDEFVEQGVAVLGLDNVVGNEFRWVGRRFITLEKYETLKRYTVRTGDVLVSIMGTTGRCAIVPDDIGTAINTKHICAITPHPELVQPEFLRAAFLWHPESRSHLLRQTKGSIMDGLNLGIIKSMPLPVPALQLQREFAAKVGAISAQRAAVATALALDDELFASLQHRAFRGEP
jgi:type I restriction enzyme S subunit